MLCTIIYTNIIHTDTRLIINNKTAISKGGSSWCLGKKDKCKQNALSKTLSTLTKIVLAIEENDLALVLIEYR